MAFALAAMGTHEVSAGFGGVTIGGGAYGRVLAGAGGVRSCSIAVIMSLSVVWDGVCSRVVEALDV